MMTSMKRYCTFVIFFLFIFAANAQNKQSSKPMEVPMCTEPGKVEWNDYDKKQSFTGNPAELTDHSLPSDSSHSMNIFSTPWKKDKKSSVDSPCSRFKEPLNL